MSIFTSQDETPEGGEEKPAEETPQNQDEGEKPAGEGETPTEGEEKKEEETPAQ